MIPSVIERHPYACVHKLPLDNANFLNKFSESLSTKTCCTRGSRMNGEDLLVRSKIEGYQNAWLHARRVTTVRKRSHGQSIVNVKRRGTSYTRKHRCLRMKVIPRRTRLARQRKHCVGRDLERDLLYANSCKGTNVLDGTEILKGGTL